MDEEHVDRGWEDEEVERRRYREARAAGLTRDAARVFALNGEDVGLLRKLVRAGLPPDQIAAIVI